MSDGQAAASSLFADMPAFRAARTSRRCQHAAELHARSPHALRPQQSLKEYLKVEQVPAGWWKHFPKFTNREQLTIYGSLWNLTAAIAGNIVGGSLVALAYASAYLKTPNK